MKLFKRVLRSRLLLLPLVFMVGFSLTNCSQEKSATPYAQRLADDANDFSNTYDKLVLGCGQDTVDQLVEGIGWGELDRLSYGVGVTNLITLVNAISPDIPNIIAVVTGLGTVRVVNMLSTVDAMMDVNKYTGAPPVDDDTIAKLALFMKGLTPAQLTGRVVGLVNAMPISWDFDTQPADQDNMDNLCKLIAHVTDTNKVVDVMDLFTLDATVTGPMKDILIGVTDVESMVEILDFMAYAAPGDMQRMVDLVEGVAARAPANDMTNMIAVLNALQGTPYYGGQKTAWLLSNISSVNTLVVVIKDVANAGKMADLINEAEGDGAGPETWDTWANQVYGPWDWNEAAGTPAQVAAPYSTIPRLLYLIEGLSVDPNPAKLVQIVNGVTDMSKMVQLVQDIAACGDTVALEDNDFVSLVTQFQDPGVNPVPVQNMGFILENTAIANMPKMRSTVDGQRLCGLVADQPAYLTKLKDLVSALDPQAWTGVTGEGPAKVAQMLNEITLLNICNLIDLVFDVNVLANLSSILNGIHPATLASPQNNAVHTMAYLVDNAIASQMVAMIDCLTTPMNVATLVNGLAEEGQIDADPIDEAGQKLAAVIDNVNDLGPPCADNDLAFLINNISDVNNMVDLMHELTLASCLNLADDLIDLMAAGNAYVDIAACNPAATGVGKMINMIDYITNLNDVATLVNGVADLTKMASIVNNVGGVNVSCNLVWLVNSVIANPGGLGVDTGDMADLMNGIAVVDIPKLTEMLTDLDSCAGCNDMVADLLAPSDDADPSIDGVGTADMITLLTNLDALPDPAVNNIAQLLKPAPTGLNDPLGYRTLTISKREGMVRLINGGVTFDCTVVNTVFPGIGPVHVAVMMNEAASANDLRDLMNALDLDWMVPMTGCGDHVGDADSDCLACVPDFCTPCTTCLMASGWCY